MWTPRVWQPPLFNDVSSLSLTLSLLSQAASTHITTFFSVFHTTYIYHCFVLTSRTKKIIKIGITNLLESSLPLPLSNFQQCKLIISRDSEHACSYFSPMVVYKNNIISNCINQYIQHKYNSKKKKKKKGNACHQQFSGQDEQIKSAERSQVKRGKRGIKKDDRNTPEN